MYRRRRSLSPRLGSGKAGEASEKCFTNLGLLSSSLPPLSPLFSSFNTRFARGSIECIENCGFFKKPKEFPTQATFSMAIDHCPDVLDYNDGTFAVDGWEGGKFKVGFLNVNLCKSSKFAAELYDESGNAGELDIPMDEESLAFEGTFIAYTGKENSYRHIKYKAVGEYVAN